MSPSQLEKDPAAGNAVIHVIVVGVDNPALTALAARVSGDGLRDDYRLQQ